MLCKEYDLNPMADGVIVSHAEGHKRGIASNHGDPEHLWRQLGMGYTMDGFRKDVREAMNETVSGTQAAEFADISEKDFRKYDRVEDSIAEHSAYLLGAMNGDKKRYEGIAGMTDYKKVAQLIKDGGYATSLTYVEKLCSIIEKWNLTQYDVKKVIPEKEVQKWYRVRKTWEDSKSQKGAYKVLKNAKACADENAGYSVFDWEGNMVYSPVSPAKEKKVGNYTGKGVFTIVAECIGLGSKKGWGKLKSGAGWISLDYAEKIS